MGHTPSTAGTFRKKFRKNSGKTPETRGKSASERVSERTSENLRKPLKTSKNLWKPLKTLPLRDPLRGRFPSQRLSVLLPPIWGAKKHINNKTRKQTYHGFVPWFFGDFCLCVFSPHKEWPEKTHKQKIATRPIPGQSRKFVYVYVFSFSLIIVLPLNKRASTGGWDGWW